LGVSSKAPISNWQGGHYDLAIEANSSDPAAILKAVWSYPGLTGPFPQRDFAPNDPSTSPERALSEPVFGLLSLAEESVVCGCVFIHPDNGSRWVELFTPLGAIAEIWDTASYPFGSITTRPQWQVRMDESYLALLNHINEAVSFQLAVAAFEMSSLSRYSAEQLCRTGIPSQRDCSIFWADGDALVYYPATRP
jgi:hypothetical protein